MNQYKKVTLGAAAFRRAVDKEVSAFRRCSVAANALGCPFATDSVGWLIAKAKIGVAAEAEGEGWEPEFDATYSEQEATAIKISDDISERFRISGCGPDAVMVLEAADKLYIAEREGWKRQRTQVPEQEIVVDVSADLLSLFSDDDLAATVKQFEHEIRKRRTSRPVLWNLDDEIPFTETDEALWLGRAL